MSEHFICDEMIDAGERQLEQCEDKGMSQRNTVRLIFLVMREIEDMALRGGESETVH